MQNTQFKKLFADCSVLSGIIKVFPPKIKNIDLAFFYELIIYPINNILSQTGFTNTDISNIIVTARTTANTTFSQTIQKIYKQDFRDTIKLNSIYTITTQSLKNTSLQISFDFNIPTVFTTNYLFP